MRKQHQLSLSRTPQGPFALWLSPQVSLICGRGENGAPFYCRCWMASVTSDSTTCKTRAPPGSCRPTPWIICDRLICLGAKRDSCCCSARRLTSSCGTSTSRKDNTPRRPLAGLNAIWRRSSLPEHQISWYELRAKLPYFLCCFYSLKNSAH